MVGAKYHCFPIFCIFTTGTPWSYINIGFKNIPLVKCLIPVKTTCTVTYIAEFSLHSFFKTARGTRIFDLTFAIATSFLEFKGNQEVTQ